MTAGGCLLYLQTRKIWAGMWRWRAAIQRDFDRLENQANREVIKFNKGNMKFCPREGISLDTITGLGLAGWRATSLNKTWRSWWSTIMSKPTVWCCDKEAQQHSGLHEKVLPADWGWSSLCDTQLWWNTSGVLFSGLGSPVQERHGHTGTSLAMIKKVLRGSSIWHRRGWNI